MSAFARLVGDLGVVQRVDGANLRAKHLALRERREELQLVGVGGDEEVLPASFRRRRLSARLELSR